MEESLTGRLHAYCGIVSHLLDMSSIMPLAMARFDLFSVGSDQTLLPAHPALLQKVACLCVWVWWRELVLVCGGHGSLTRAVESALPVTTFGILERDVGMGRARTEGWLPVIRPGRRRDGRGWRHRLRIRLLDGVRGWLRTTESSTALLVLLWIAHCGVEVQRRGEWPARWVLLSCSPRRR